MLYGLTFSMGGDAGKPDQPGTEALQFAFDTAGLNLFARATTGGTFGEWKFICGAKSGADGDGGESGGASGSSTVERADVANKAYRLASPMTISFRGDVSGEATFDGSANVVVDMNVLSGGGGGGGGGTVSEDTIRRVIQEELGDRKSIQTAIKDALQAHVDWYHASSGSDK